jgi:molybdenum cofactor cytidylyltransferase
MTRVHAVLLAAGRSSRSGPSHKLLATFDGVPLIRRSAETALAARMAGVSVVVGHRADEMRRALAGLPVALVENARFAEGLSTSLIAGFAAVPAEAEGVLVMLADQPLLAAADLDALLARFAPDGRGSIVVATDGGRRFNPVVIARRYADEVRELTGDVGAKPLFSRHAEAVIDVEIGRAASCDVDSREAIVQAGGVPADVAPN